MKLAAILALAAWLSSASAHGQHYVPAAPKLTVQSAAGKTINGVPPAVREGWMRMANGASETLYGSPCMMYPYGAVIVWPNNTLLALGANAGHTGDATQHGEINVIQRAVSILRDEKGLSPGEIREALSTCSLYTNGEPCPMCASAIRWSGFREMIYGTSIEQLLEFGSGQILISSMEIMAASHPLGTPITVLPLVLSEETDVMFAWQTNGTAPCPKGCAREAFTSELVTPMCKPLAEVQDALRVEL